MMARSPRTSLATGGGALMDGGGGVGLLMSDDAFMNGGVGPQISGGHIPNSSGYIFGP